MNIRACSTPMLKRSEMYSYGVDAWYFGLCDIYLVPLCITLARKDIRFLIEENTFSPLLAVNVISVKNSSFKAGSKV